jgi:hypothetical protein
MRNYLQNHRKILGVSGTLIALVVATVYIFITPDYHETDIIQQTVLRYSHSACWVLLALASLTWGLWNKVAVAMYFTYGALLLYVCFVAVVLMNGTS